MRKYKVDSECDQCLEIKPLVMRVQYAVPGTTISCLECVNCRLMISPRECLSHDCCPKYYWDHMVSYG